MKILAGVVVWIVGAVFSFANAAVVSYDFQAQVDHVDNALAGLIAPGGVFSGSLTFETSMPDALGSPEYGVYYDAGLAGTTPFGDYVPTNASNFYLQVTDTTSADMIKVYMPIVGPAFNGHLPQLFYIQLSSDGSMVANDSFPTLEMTPDTYFAVEYDTGAYVTGHLLSLTQISAVPEPQSVALFGLGLLGLAFTRRRA